MPSIYLSEFDLPNIALANALEGNWSAVGRALLPGQQDTLSPHERQTVAEKWFGKHDPGVFQRVLETTTNPTLIFLAIATTRTKSPALSDYIQHDKYLQNAQAKILPFIDDIASFDELYAGSPLPDLFHEFGFRKAKVQNEATNRLTKALLRYAKNTGDVPSKASWDKMVAVMDGVDDPAHESWEFLQKAYAQYSPEKAQRVAELRNQLKHINLEATLTPAEREFIKDFREMSDYLYATSVSEEGVQAAARVKALKKGFKGALGDYRERYWRHLPTRMSDEAKLLMEESLKTDLKFKDSLLAGGKELYNLRLTGPRGATMTFKEYQTIMSMVAEENPDATIAELRRLVPEYMKHYFGNKVKGPLEYVASGAQYMRFGRRAPDAQFLRRLGGPFAELGDMVDKGVYLAKPKSAPVPIGQYRMDMGVPSVWIHESARDYAWSSHLPDARVSIGERVMEIARHYRANDPVRSSMLTDTYIPALYLDSTYEQAARSARWDSLRMRGAELLESDLAKKVIPSKLREGFVTSLKEAPSYSTKLMSQRLAGLFHYGTLGFPNLGSSLKNLMQTVISTYPTIGLKYTIHGLQETFSRVQLAANTFLKNGGRMSMKTAFESAFSDIHSSDLELGHEVLQAFSSAESSLSQAMLKKGSLKKVWGILTQAIMVPFRNTEILNRAVMFYGARKGFADELAGKTIPLDTFTGETNVALEKGFTQAELALGTESPNRLVREITKGARSLVSLAHTTGGVQGTPNMLMKWPTLGKQLMGFPLRFASYLMRGGWGRVARVALGSALAAGAAYTLFGDAGKKFVRDATVFGAVPTPTDYGVFAPIPLVPPIGQVIGAAGMALAGEPKHLGRAAMLLVPGGVGLTRLLPLAGSKTLGHVFNKEYADYNHPTPDGLIPVYTPDDGLIGYESQPSLMLKAWGIPNSTPAQEQVVTSWLTKNGDRIASLRREYMDALASNDQRAADRIEKQWEKSFPGTGPIPIKASHLRSLHLRRDVSRMERTLEGLPPELRGQFMSAISMSLASGGPELMGLDERGLMSGPTIKARDPYRVSTHTPAGSILPGGIMETGSLTAQDLLERSQMYAGR